MSRIARCSMAVLATCALAVASAGHAAAADKVAASSSVRFTATGVYSDGTSRVFVVRSDHDSDGDGVPDQGELRVTCSGGSVVSAVYSSRDAGSGMATGKRQHGPVTMSSATFRGTWDLKEAKGARTAASNAATPVVLDSSGASACRA